MAKLRLYHGTAHGFDKFDDRFVMGTEPNSALGIHLTEFPATAAAYAEMSAQDRTAGVPRVLVLDVEIDKAALVTSDEDFLGRPLDLPLGADGSRTREEYVAVRHTLEAAGCHAVALDSYIDDLCGTWVVFSPGQIEIVGAMEIIDAYEMEPEILDWTGVEMMSTALFKEEAGLAHTVEPIGKASA